MKNGAVGYVRVSTKRQADEFNLDKQESMLRELEAKKGARLHEIFADPGKSAHIEADKRPKFVEMLKYLRQHKSEIRYVFFANDSRMSRDISQALEVAFNVFPKLGIEPVFANMPDLDLTTAEGRIQLAAAFHASWADSERRKENAVKNWRFAAVSGRWPSKVSPGYQNKGGKAGSNIERDPDRAPHFKRLFELVDTGVCPKDALKTVTAEGLRNRNGKPYRMTDIYKYLRNPIYAGLIRYKTGPRNGPKKYTEIMPGLQEPIISEALFWRVQDKLDGNKTHGGKRQPRTDHPFRARCVCGTKLTVDVKKGGKYAYYVCPKCKLHHPSKSVEQQIADQVLAPFSDYMKKAWMERAADFYSRQTAHIAARLKELQRRKVALEEQKRTLVDQLSRPGLDGELRQEYEEKIKDIRGRIRDVEAESSSLLVESGRGDEWSKFAEMIYTSDFPKLWGYCTPEERERVRSLLFSDDSFFSKNGEISNSASYSLHGVLTETPEELEQWRALRDSNSRPSGS